MDEMNNAKELTRRRFMERATRGFGFAIAAIIGLPAIGLGIASATGGAIRTLVKVGSQSQLGPEPLAVPINYVARDAWRETRQQAVVYLRQPPGGKVEALSARCTHLGCTVHWVAAANRFQCPCHGSQFAADGSVLHGPAERPLDRLTVSKRGQDVFVQV
ncbi:MAG TPA: ubiquinol-cytochrome c reductase iron-sulfur subunit [Candidatus Dormibacteraeota bacterium]|jgi:Rieske Fe-S protein